jgi:N6-adenosine-specific RNA methylase IME4
VTQHSLFDAGPEYRCILADPAWAERGGGKIVRGAQRHYGLEGKLGDIEPHYRMIVDSGIWRPAANAHFWCWYTDTFMWDAGALVRRLGFRPVRTYQWVKTSRDISDDELQQLDDDELDALLRMGIGQYARGCHEGMILGIRGEGQSPDVWTGNRSVRSAFHAAHPKDQRGQRIHSRKPEKSYRVIESVSKGPRLEFNARVAREGWDRHGNEAPSAPEATT